MRINAFIIIAVLLFAISVSAQEDTDTPRTYYLGADLSYVNEMDDCGAEYRMNGVVRDPYEIFADYGANLVRIRLWHTPTWTDYSTFEDIVRAFQRAHDLGMNTLLDFHYSDTWADPEHQTVPAEWADLADLEELGQALYDYTFDALMRLDSLGLMPDMVQIGNEINSAILRQAGAPGYPIDWERNAFLINEGIRAARDAGAQGEKSPQVILHIAQPENVEGWLLSATRAGVVDFDIIGLSYYVGWSRYTVATTGSVINQLRYRFGKEVMIVETAYPWTLGSVPESASNIMGRDFLTDAYPATPSGQRQFMIDLTQSTILNGGLGVIYWEPAWVSTDCSTLWGQGSHWENATFFDFRSGNEVLEGIEFLNFSYEYPVNVQLQFVPDGDRPEQIFFWGDFTGTGRRLLSLLPDETGTFRLNAYLMPGAEIHYQFYSEPPASTETALVSGSCLDDEGYITLTVPPEDTLLGYAPGQCH